ncbi:FecCD family ABC transporter permease [Muribaculum intestinale]|jgi:iron complex transport system permease protein|uniref:Iron ABC transporter permease n=1 Tax=Muribaculum intestinale TaxID=1796646 RepID=A0A4V3RUE0_9BACT|nr:iron ABC transporter permease [Muribaculum intestinale]MYM12330.1 iron chelate uptake ABC transporter family permease subunit [Muribaculum intestinale]TGY74459.1 iron ABC transporter permease [Muribaculum intestinale]
MRTRKTIIFILLGVAAVILFVIDMATGAVPIPLNQVVAAIAGGDCPEMTARIVINIRLVKAVVALLAGAALSVSGLEMQTLFRNPLAGPYVLGISSGASLGVALFILGAPLAGLSGYVDSIGIVGAAWIGASAVLAVIAFVGRRITDIMVILILGIMFSSGVSAIVQVLQYLSHEDALKSFVIWTMGSLGEVTISQLIVAVPAVIAGLVLAVAAVKPLNLLLLGEDYARSMGLNPLRSRALLFMSTTLLAGTVTAFCGPIGFIGMALPHVARMLFSDADHRVLIPACMLVGADVMLACDIISKFFTVPVNAITALFGIPIVVWVVVKNKPVTA